MEKLKVFFIISLFVQVAFAQTPSLLENFASGFTNFFNNINSAVTNIVGNVLSFGQNVSKEVLNFATGLYNRVTTAGTGVLQTATNSLTKTSMETSNILNNTVQYLTDLASKGGTTISGVLNSLTTLTESIPKAFLNRTNLISSIKNLANQATTLTQNNTEKVITPLSTSLSKIISKISTNLRSLSQLQNFPKSFSNSPGDIYKTLNDTTNDIKALIKSNPGLEKSLISVIDTLNNVTNSYQTLVQETTNLISNSALNLFETASSKVGEIFESINKKLSSLEAEVSKIIESVEDLVDTATDEIETAISDNDHAISNALSSSEPQATLSNELGLATRQLQSAISSLGDSSSSAVQTITDQLQSLIKSTSNTIGTIIETTASSVPELFQGITSSIQKIISNGLSGSNNCISDAEIVIHDNVNQSVQNFIVCGKRTANDTQNLTSTSLTYLKEAIASIDELAEQLSNCSGLYNTSTASQSVTDSQTAACMNNVLVNVRNNPALDTLSKIQTKISNLSRIMTENLLSCTDKTLNDLKDKIKTIVFKFNACTRFGI